MIPIGVEIFVAHKPINMRMPFDRLGGLVREEIGRDPRCSAMFIFFARRRTHHPVATRYVRIARRPRRRQALRRATTALTSTRHRIYLV